MTTSPRSTSVRRVEQVLDRLAPFASVLAALVACSVLLGWNLDSTLLVRVVPLPGAGLMMPNTALGFLASGTALWLLHEKEESRWRCWTGWALAVAAVLLGGLTLCEYLFKVDLGIDLLLFSETVQHRVPNFPGRPAPMTALSFCFTGLALLLLRLETRREWRPARLLALGVTLIATQALLRYAYLEESLLEPARRISTQPPFTPMAVHTALLFLVLSLGILSVHPERGLMGVILREDMGGSMARRLLPAAILMPLLVGGVRLLGERLGLYGTTFGVSLVVLATLTALLLIIAWNAKALSRAEEVLRDSEERFRTSFEDAPIGMALVGLDGRFLNVNDSLCQLVGYSQKELPTKTFQDITHPEDLDLDLANMRRLRQGEISSYQLEKRYIHKAGHLVTILLTGSVVRDARGEPLHFIAQIQDISERKQLEQTWRFLAEAGPRLAASLDPQTTLATVARLAVPTLADWCVVDLLGDDERVHWVESMAATPEKTQVLREMLAAHPHDPSRQGRLVAHVLRTGQPMLLPEITGAVLEATAEDAHHLELLRRLEPLSVIIVPLLAREHILGVIILATSESGHRYGERDLALAQELARRAALAIDNARLHEQSEQATRMRDEVLRIVAHDLRTPLNVINLSAGSLLRRSPEERATDTKPLESIRKAVERSTRLIEDLLDVARMEAGRLSVDRGPEESASLVQEVADLHRALAEAKSIQLTVSVPEDAPAVFADHDRVLQILSNLLGNALKFTPEGGRVSLQVEPMGSRVRFSVCDTGRGIPAEDLPYLFEPFWQACAGRKEGAGLGLAIVKGLVEAHGGHLWVESSPGVGSTFFFTLPTLEEAREKPPHHA
ncbi:ATP-binding protein [Archangium sp.]|uniref:sensor histidine kinase n=1 Tax=Archangium sp. TaxID=1872627 RepID=UPI00286A641D|nr:ATP-binding protein [Archangium sp.]